MLTDSLNNPSEHRLEGKDWPSNGFTMIGMKRLENLHYCIERVLLEGVPGDFLEAGVWKGGATIFMSAVLRERGIMDRRVWVADSFKGLPPPKPEYPADANDEHYRVPELAVSRQTVEEGFRRFGLLSKNVVFVEGWFNETLPACGVEKLALLRLDGDMYESTITCLDALYDRVQTGGYIIVDDYGYIQSCRQAVHDFLDKRKLKPVIHSIDWTGVFWKKEN